MRLRQGASVPSDSDRDRICFRIVLLAGAMAGAGLDHGANLEAEATEVRVTTRALARMGRVTGRRAARRHAHC